MCNVCLVFYQCGTQVCVLNILNGSRLLCALFLHSFVLKFFLHFFLAHFPIELSLFQAFVLHGTKQRNIYAILKREQQQALCGYLNCSHATKNVHVADIQHTIYIP